MAVWPSPSSLGKCVNLSQMLGTCCLLSPNCLYYTVLFDFFLAHKLYYALGAVTMLFLLVFKFIVGLYIACFNG